MVNVNASSSLCTLFMAAKVINSCFGFRLYWKSCLHHKVNWIMLLCSCGQTRQWHCGTKTSSALLIEYSPVGMGRSLQAG